MFIGLTAVHIHREIKNLKSGIPGSVSGSVGDGDPPSGIRGSGPAGRWLG